MEAALHNQEPGKLTGTMLGGRYLIEEQLDEGGMGAVYLARDQKLHNKPVVVKVLLEKSLKDERSALKFRQEKEAMSRIDHPGVVGILDTGELPDGKPYIVMQYIDGTSLREVIKAQPEGLDLKRVARIMKQAGAALDVIHERKIYHRDLKPENIMIQRLGRDEEQVKILDFGVAKVKESLIAPSTITGAEIVGTIVYMSPEQLRGEKVTAASDIYSLGVIAYEMVTGRRPFKPHTIAHLAEMQRQNVRVKPADLQPRLSEEGERIILKALSFDPALRYQNAAEFGDSLAHALVSEEETFWPPRDAAAEHHASLASGERSRSLSTTTKPVSHPSKPSGAPALPEAIDRAAPETKAHRRNRWAKIAAPLVLVAALLIGGYMFFVNRRSASGNNASPSSVEPADERSLAYWLTVQKIREGKPYLQPFQSSGQEIFENGYKFRLNVSSPQSGYLYVFNEGADVKTGMSFTIIYPTPATNKGSAKLEADRPMRTNWNTFEGRAGTEEFWIVWSASPIEQMEAARDAAFRNEEGAITDAAMVRTVKDFLTKYSDPKIETTKDTMRRQTSVRGKGDILVKLVELEHR